jgi:hypothetical protein
MKIEFTDEERSALEVHGINVAALPLENMKIVAANMGANWVQQANISIFNLTLAGAVGQAPIIQRAPASAIRLLKPEQDKK